jgi:Zn-dependent protease
MVSSQGSGIAAVLSMDKNRGWSIGSIRGVAVRLHFTLIFLLAYVILIANAQFPTVIEQSGIDSSLIYGSPGLWSFIFAFALFGSILLHEFGHVFMAQSLGVQVRSVTLMMLGGVSEMDQIPTRPYSEFKISIVGPLVSFLIAGALLVLERFTLSANVDLFCYWLSRVNIVLGVFNLIPALPLDGGRAFRSILSARTGNLRATMIAAKLAKTIAIVLGLIGLFGFNFLLMLIGVFIYGAANNELIVTSKKVLLKGLTVGELTRWISGISESQTLGFAIREMIQTRSRFLPVSTNTGEVNLLSLDQVKNIPRDLWDRLRVSQLIQQGKRVLNPEDELESVFSEIMVSGALPVKDSDFRKGIIQYRDISDFIDFKGIDPEFREEEQAA